MADLLPLFLNLTGRTVVLVGGGPVATAKLRQLVAAGAHVRVIAPEMTDEIRDASPPSVTIEQRPFAPADLDQAWLVVAAATPDGQPPRRRGRGGAAHLRQRGRRPANATAFLGGIVRRDGVTLAISTSGDAPALTSLLREGIDALLPRDLATWMWQARAARVAWRREGADGRTKPRLLQALNALYPDNPAGADAHAEKNILAMSATAQVERPRVPWLNGPEDSWL
jgi:uroporphyrin-III C-methyltransferase/precorrin-2 dehydrogenase/sirohydrochlorin ferrochelatase